MGTPVCVILQLLLSPPSAGSYLTDIIPRESSYMHGYIAEQLVCCNPNQDITFQIWYNIYIMSFAYTNYSRSIAGVIALDRYFLDLKERGTGEMVRHTCQLIHAVRHGVQPSQYVVKINGVSAAPLSCAFLCSLHLRNKTKHKKLDHNKLVVVVIIYLTPSKGLSGQWEAWIRTSLHVHGFSLNNHFNTTPEIHLAMCE